MGIWGNRIWTQFEPEEQGTTELMAIQGRKKTAWADVKYARLTPCGATRGQAAHAALLGSGLGGPLFFFVETTKACSESADLGPLVLPAPV